MTQDNRLNDTDIVAMGEAEQIAYIKAHLSDVWWRLNNLYKIVNEDGELVTFRMRPAQRNCSKICTIEISF